MRNSLQKVRQSCKILGADHSLVNIVVIIRTKESGIGYWILSMTISGAGLDDQLEACVKLDSIITVADAKNLHFQLKKHEDSSTFLEAFLQIAFAVSESDADIIVTLNMCTAGLLCKKLLSDGGNVVVNSITEVINNASRALSAVFTDPHVLDCPICLQPLCVPVFQTQRAIQPHTAIDTETTPCIQFVGMPENLRIQRNRVVCCYGLKTYPLVIYVPQPFAATTIMEALEAKFDLIQAQHKGVSPGEGTDATMSDDEEDQVESDANLYDGSLNGHDSMGFGPLVPTESEMSLIEYVRQELKHELKHVSLRPS
ncbi:hypothetical protein Tco_0556929 [Tanacetum coccineum]